jgi:hypothetical protein
VLRPRRWPASPTVADRTIVADPPGPQYRTDTDIAARDTPFLDADVFPRTDQSEFGNAWRYELVHGAMAAHAAPSPKHGVILNNLVGELYNRLRNHPECRFGGRQWRRAAVRAARNHAVIT